MKDLKCWVFYVLNKVSIDYIGLKMATAIIGPVQKGPHWQTYFKKYFYYDENDWMNEEYLEEKNVLPSTPKRSWWMPRKISGLTAFLFLVFHTVKNKLDDDPNTWYQTSVTKPNQWLWIQIHWIWFWIQNVNNFDMNPGLCYCYQFWKIQIK